MDFLGDMVAEVEADTLRGTLAEKKGYAPFETLEDVEAGTLIDTAEKREG